MLKLSVFKAPEYPDVYEAYGQRKQSRCPNDIGLADECPDIARMGVECILDQVSEEPKP